jgi:hypothetical protein
VANFFAPCRPKKKNLLVLEYVIAYMVGFFNTHKIRKRKKMRKFGSEDIEKEKHCFQPLQIHLPF